MDTAVVRNSEGKIAGTTIRLMVLLVTVIAVVALMFNSVSADEKPVYTGEEYYGTYELYHDGELRIKCEFDDSFGSLTITLENLPSEVLSKTETITADITGFTDEGVYLSGYQCDTSKISKITFVNNGDCKNLKLGIEKISGSIKDGIILPEGAEIDSLQLSYLDKVESIDYLSKYQINSLDLYSMHGIKKLDLSSSVIKEIEVESLYYVNELKLPAGATSVAVISCQRLKELTVPDYCEHFKLNYCLELEKITLPLSIKDLVSEEYCFYKCESLKDIYYKGSPASLGKITVTLALYDSDGWNWSYIVPETPVADLLKEYQIHYFLGKKSAWIKSGNQWVYADDKGQGVTGWQKISGDWYCFNDESIMLTGWLEDGGEWYYLKESGVMAQGWQTVKGKYYYFKAGGAMASEEYCDGYWLDKSGEWNYKARASWKSDSKGWYYQDTTGWYAKNQWLRIDGKWYFFKPDGYMAYSEYWNGYWFNADGTWTYQHKATWRGNSSTGWWYGDDTGWYAKNESVWINGNRYNFNAEGYCTNP